MIRPASRWPHDPTRSHRRSEAVRRTVGRGDIGTLPLIRRGPCRVVCEVKPVTQLTDEGVVNYHYRVNFFGSVMRPA